jgi:hypothetical protein
MDPSRFSLPVSAPVSLEEMQDGARRIISPDAVISDPIWMSRFGNETRLADSYRRGRIFLAGDAAHIHLPSGGQGMNTGLQDAMNLGWKLAGVIRGRAPESILDSYERERRLVGEQLMQNTLAQGAIIGAFGPEGVALRATIERLLSLPAVNRNIAGMISGLDIAYPEAVMTGYDVGAAEWVGRRLPNAKLRLGDGSTISLYTLLYGGDWVELSMADGVRCPRPVGIEPNWIKAHRVSVVEDLCSLRELASVLIRPDGHVAHAQTRPREA